MRRQRSLLLVLAVLLCSAGHGRAQEKTAFPNTADGLKRQFEQILAAAKAKHGEQVASLGKELLLPDYDAWFRKTFGEEKGSKVSEEYRRNVPALENQAVELFAKRISEGQTEVHVELFGKDESVVQLAQTPHDFYWLRMTRPGEKLGFRMFVFVHVDGKFRFLGKMRALK